MKPTTLIPFYLLEAFGSKPFTGNPAAVCFLSSKLTHTVMQKIATQFNLSETAFVSPIEGGFDIRWFTPLCEVSLCGHATLAAAAALNHQNKELNRFQFFSKSGELKCQKVSDRFELTFPKWEAQPLGSIDETWQAVFPEANSFSVHDKILIVEFSDATQVISFEPYFDLLKKLPFNGVFITAKSEDSTYDFISRCFFSSEGIPEDPVTGSAHCTLAPYWAKKLKKNELRAFQASARSGVVMTQVLNDSVLISGKTRIFASGNLHWDTFLT